MTPMIVLRLRSAIGGPTLGTEYARAGSWREDTVQSARKPVDLGATQYVSTFLTNHIVSAREPLSGGAWALEIPALGSK